jgi:hypothetical protein
VTPEKTKKPRWDEGGESEPEAKEEGIGKEAEADEDNDCVKDEDDSEDEECSDRATRNSVMGFGRHARLTYREVMTDHYDYVIWAKAHAGDATGRLRNFLEWVESPEGESFPERITFGMHNGKSFQKVAVEDPSYHRRYKAKNPECHKLDDYIRYFSRHGNQRAANEGEMATIAFHAGIYQRITTRTAITEKGRKITMTITCRHRASATMKKMMIQRNMMEKMTMMPVKKTMIKKMKIAE